MDTHGPLTRIRAFQARIDEAAAEQVVAWEHGTALLSPSIDRVWDANHCRLDDPGEASAAEIAAAASRVADEAGMAHVAIVAGEEDAARLGPELVELGFEPTEHVTLVLSGRPDPPAVNVEVASFADVAPHRAMLTLEFFPGNQELADQLGVLDTRLEATIGGEWFAVREDGAIVSRAWLLHAGGVAQVEDVATTSTARGRGLARAVVSAAAIAALDAGNDTIFVVADSDGNAQRLYCRLGFEPAGLSTRFVLKR